MMRLRIAEKTGEQAVALRLMRKPTGEYLNVLVHLRGLAVGKDPVTGEDFWFLIGLYCDVGDTEADTPEAVEANAASIARLEEQVHNIVSDHLDVVLTDELWAAMPSAASSEPLQKVFPECRWMQSTNVE